MSRRDAQHPYLSQFVKSSRKGLVKRCSCKNLSEGQPLCGRILLQHEDTWCPQPHQSLAAAISSATSAKLPEHTGRCVAAGGGLGAAGTARTSLGRIRKPVGKAWSGQPCLDLRKCLHVLLISGCLLGGNYRFPNTRVHKQPDQYRGSDGPRSLRSDTTHLMAKYWQYPCLVTLSRPHARTTSRFSFPLPKIKKLLRVTEPFLQEEFTKTLS